MRHENHSISKTFASICTAAILVGKVSANGFVALDIISTLNFVQNVLSHIGPIISAILFIIAGLFYAIGQLFPSHQRASFQTTATDMIIGAIIVAALSIASNSFALASTHLLANVSLTNTT